MKDSWMITLILIIFTCFSFAEEVQKLVLEDIINVELQPNIPKMFKITIDKQIVNETQLYVSAQSPWNDPYEIPSMKITSDKDYNQICFDALDEFTDVCSIPTQELTLKRQFQIQIKCVVKCSLQISAYLSQVLQLDIGDRIILSAMENFGIGQAIEIQIPQKAQFTQILISATIENLEDVEEGLKLNVNYGNYNDVSLPTLEKYQIKGESTWNDGVGVSLSKEVIKGGQWIKLLLYASEKMKVRFSTQLVNGNNYNIILNQQRYDLISYGEGRIYTLDLTEFKDDLIDDNIDVSFSIYSGNPDIKISFDKSFPAQKTINNNYISGTINCIVTPEIREKFKFTGLIFIKVESYWASSYKFLTWLNRKQFAPLLLENTQITELFKGENIQNYIYKEEIYIPKNQTNKNTIFKYVLKVEMIQGNSILGIRRCISLQKNNSLDCLLKAPKQLQANDVETSFRQIQGEVQSSFTTHQIRFHYDYTKCTSVTSINGTFYTCVFQIVATYDESTYNHTSFAITLYKRELSVALKQGQVVKDTVDKGSYHFFMFRLPSISNISEVRFFITTIQGDSLMLGSTAEQFPTIMDIGTKNIVLSSNNVMEFSDLKESVIYLSVYGYEKSDYTISTSVHRFVKDAKQKETQQTMSDIELKQNMIQQYTISQKHQKLVFSFHPEQKSVVRLSVNNLQGKVSYQVMKIVKDKQQFKNIEVKCRDSGQLCQFNTNEALQYRVIVTGSPSSTQVFKIGFRYPQNEQRCIQEPMNTPFIIDIKKGQKMCVSYFLKEPKQLQVMISLSSLQLISGGITANLKVGKKTIQIQQHSKRISEDEVLIACDGKDKFQTCPLSLQFVAFQTIMFEAVLEQVGNQMILFEGTQQKIVTDSINKKNGKYFYYELFQDKSVKIFFTSQGDSSYTILAKVLDESQYLKSNVPLFPHIEEFGTNIFKRITTGQIAMIRISHSQIKKTKCVDCMILISVFKNNGLERDMVKFTIQVTQSNSHLQVGESKIGNLEEGQIYQYSVSTKDIPGGLFSISPIHNDNCAEIFLGEEQLNASNQSVNYKPYLNLPLTNQDYKIYVKGYKQCSFQVSFSSNSQPIHQIKRFLPFTLTLTNNSLQYLLYYHDNNSSFKIVENIQSGDSSIFVRAIKKNEELIAILKEKLQTYPFGDDDAFSDITIDNQSADFCSNCYYVIAIEGTPNIQEDVVILPENALIPIRQNTILKDRLPEGKEPKKYIYHSINSFNFTIGILYGKLKVTITGPGGNQVLQQTIQQVKSYNVKHPREADNNFIDLFDESSKFTISILPIEDCAFYISITKNNLLVRIKQGLPTIVELNNQTKTYIEFINYNDANTITVLVEGLCNDTIAEDQITFQSQIQDKSIQSIVLKGIVKSQNSFNLEFNTFQSVYGLSMKLNNHPKINVSILLVKDKMTHLMSSHYNLFKYEGIFQIYKIDKSLMIQLYNCIGEVEVHASNNFTELEQQKNTKEIVLQKANYGGHYVITGDSEEGQYFLKTLNKNKNKKDLLYLISYSFYDKNDPMPYKKISTSTDKISVNIVDSKRTFTLSPVLPKQSPQALYLESVEYTLIISTSQIGVSEYSQCFLGEPYIKRFYVSGNFQSDESIPTFTIQNVDLQSKLGKIQKIYVGAVAKIELKNSKPDYPTSLTYIYDSTQLYLEILNQQNSALSYFVWVVLPLLLASFFLMIGCRLCIKKIYSNYYPTTLVEEDPYAGSDGTFKSQQK